jgi:hypothetical protein
MEGTTPATPAQPPRVLNGYRTAFAGDAGDAGDDSLLLSTPGCWTSRAGVAVARTPLCVKKRQLGGVKGKGDADNAPYRAGMALCGITPTPAVPSIGVGLAEYAGQRVVVTPSRGGVLMDRYTLAGVDTGT